MNRTSSRLTFLYKGAIPSANAVSSPNSFHPDQPAADDHERELPSLAPGVRLDVGPLETAR